jgi:hypothetical protein
MHALIAVPPPRRLHSTALRLLTVTIVALGLAACGTTTPSVSPASSLAATSVPSAAVTPTSPPTAAVPSAVATPVATAAATPVASAAAGPCKTLEVIATAGPINGAAGSREADITVKSAGAGSCRLPTIPVIAVVDSSNRELLRSKLPTTDEGPMLTSKRAEAFSFLMSNWCDQTATFPFRFELELAGGSAPIAGLTMTADDVPPCNGPGQPASISTNGWTGP